MGTQIHPTAIVDPNAQLGCDVSIGPYTVVGPNVQIGDGSRIHNHVTLTGYSLLGKNVEIHPNAVIGGPPQDLKFKGEKTILEIGDGTCIRECCTLNPGTELGGGRTAVGSDCLIMAYVHVAHDCVIEDRVIIVNGAQLAGHVHVHSDARISGLAAVHHFVRIGRGAFVAGCAKLSVDVPPYSLAEGHPARVRTLNLEGIKRMKLPEIEVAALKDTFRRIYKSDSSSRAAVLASIETDGYLQFLRVREFVDFVRQMDQGKHGRGRETQRIALPPEQRDGRLSERRSCGDTPINGTPAVTESA